MIIGNCSVTTAVLSNNGFKKIVEIHLKPGRKKQVFLLKIRREFGLLPIFITCYPGNTEVISTYAAGLGLKPVGWLIRQT